MIHNLTITPLKQFHDSRGRVMHMLRSTDPHFTKFGEVYFSWVYPNVVKAWHKHTEMLMNYAVPIGRIKVVLFDDRPQSPTNGLVEEYYMSADNYYLLTIPPQIWYGFTCVGTESAMIVNCSDIPHNPSEIERIAYNDARIPYSWEHVHG